VGDKTFQEWCIVELFGHQKVAGLVSEQAIGGCSFIRVDVPASEHSPAMTKFYGQGAIYCMTPVTEDLARRRKTLRWFMSPSLLPGTSRRQRD
jgi:hypothetical protein